MEYTDTEIIEFGELITSMTLCCYLHRGDLPKALRKCGKLVNRRLTQPSIKKIAKGLAKAKNPIKFAEGRFTDIHKLGLEVDEFVAYTFGLVDNG